MSVKEKSIAIVGLGYVGLPLAAALARAGFTVAGYDIQQSRIDELKKGHDRTNELTEQQLKTVSINYSTDAAILKQADVVIVTVPTPIDKENNPDLSPVTGAMTTIGQHLKKGATVVLESTVYPGVMEDICAPILEKESGLKSGTDFFLGYSPERINPGDKEHTVDKIAKVVGAQDEKTLEMLAELYGAVTTGGIHKAPSIKVAEMAKAIENAQRDLNIAYINEVALLCYHLGIRTSDVLAAAGTKWNFLKFQPGLVGGHCIGVDPYYLVEKAKQLGIETHVISAGRRVNDAMPALVVKKVMDALELPPGEKPRVLVLGLTFKENIPDLRNSKSFDVARELEKAGAIVEVHDPHHPPEMLTRHELAAANLDKGQYDAVLFLVPHEHYKNFSTADWHKLVKPNGVLYDLKALLDPNEIKTEGRKHLSL